MNISDPIILQHNFDVNILYQNNPENVDIRKIMAESIKYNVPLDKVFIEGKHGIFIASQKDHNATYDFDVFLDYFNDRNELYGEIYGNNGNEIVKIANNIVNSQKKFIDGVLYELLILSKFNSPISNKMYQAMYYSVIISTKNSWFGLFKKRIAKINHRHIFKLYIGLD